VDQAIASVTAPGGEEIAHASVGEGPPLVLAAWWTSHLEEDWHDEGLRSFVESLAQHHRVVRYDRPGVGLSARVDRPYDLEAETTYLRTVIDATGDDPVDLMGISCGGPTSIRFAVEEPRRVRNLVLFASYVTGADIAGGETRQALCDLVRANWGLGSQTLTNLFLPDATPSAARRFARTQRRSAAPEVAADLLDLTFRLDASEHVDRVDVPVLVLHRAHDTVIRAELGQDLARRIDGATYHELEGTAHSPWSQDVSDGLDAISAFLGDAAVPEPPMRELATVCFVDIVDSTRILSDIGDRRWRSRLDALGALMGEEAAARGGSIVKDTGDGAMLSFATPGGALEFCRAIRSRSGRIGLRLRSGVHTGEIERRGDDITGVGVVAASRVADRAEAGQILATRTVADLAAGRGEAFVDRGTHELKGLDGEWPLVEVAPPRAGGESEPTSDRPGEVRFGDCVLDVGAYELRRDGEVVDVEPQVFDVLALLVEHAGELVTKERLLDEVWGDRFVSESALTSRIRSARLAVGDDGRRQELIATVHGRGYRFVAELD
jgi:class 3 adenylate cyclase